MPNQVAGSADKSLVRPWQGKFRARVREIAAAVAACLCTLAAGASAAVAAESAWPTAQAKAYNFDFVPYLDPPAKPAAICLVDSGVDITPDTPADSPEGPILERTALDGGPGTAPDSDHGTFMAMTAGAPMNDWGTVGLWPGVRIVSVRAMPRGQTSFPFADYERAINACTKLASQYNIVAINLSLGCNCTYTQADLTTLENRIGEAHLPRYDLNVVASAGNNGGSIGMPAAADGVLSVGAGDMARSLCRYSNSGTALDVLAPGCELDGADPSTGEPFIDWGGGTSPAGAVTSSVLAALRSYRPDIHWDAAENVLGLSRGRVLNVEMAFREVGLGPLVDEAKAREAAAAASANNAADTSVSTPSASQRAPDSFSLDGQPARLTAGNRPRVLSIKRLSGRIFISVANRPRAMRLVVSLQQRIGEFRYRTVTRVSKQSDRISVADRGVRRGQLVVFFVSPDRRRTSALYRRLPG